MTFDTGAAGATDAAGTAEAAGVGETVAQLRLAIARTARVLRQDAARHGAGELTPTAVSALATVERERALSPSALAALEGIKRPTATRILARLEQEGLLERAGDPDDGRRSVLAISAAGKRELGRLRSRKDAFLARRIAALDADEVATLARAAALLERMLDTERERDAKPRPAADRGRNAERGRS